MTFVVNGESPPIACTSLTADSTVVNASFSESAISREIVFNTHSIKSLDSKL